MMNKWITTAALVLASGSAASAAPAQGSAERPTIVLVHGAFAESSSWDGVTGQLLRDGYPVIAAANPLRGIKEDGAYLSSIVDAIEGPVVLVGHSYAGAVISAVRSPNVKALVFVAGYALAPGESAASMSAKFPTGTLGQALAPPVAVPGGAKDLYILPAKFWAQFAADVPAQDAAKMAATQRPVTEAALNEAAGTAGWQNTPSWFIYGALDKNIPATAQAFMAKRASAREVIEVPGASHVVMISHADAVTGMIKRAAGR